MITATEMLLYAKISCPAWAANTAYEVGQFVTNSSIVYQCTAKHTSPGTFSTTNWTASHIITEAIAAAAGEITSYCRRGFVLQNYTQYYDGNGGNRIFIHNKPLNTGAGKVTVLNYIDGDDGWQDIIDGSGDTIDNSTLRTEDQIVLLKGYTFPIGSKNIMCTYEGGSSVIPAEVKGVCFEKAYWFYKSSPHGGDRLGLTSENLGGSSSSGKGFDPEAMRTRHEKTLDKYRIHNV